MYALSRGCPCGYEYVWFYGKLVSRNSRKERSSDTMSNLQKSRKMTNMLPIPKSSSRHTGKTMNKSVVNSLHRDRKTNRSELSSRRTHRKMADNRRDSKTTRTLGSRRFPTKMDRPRLTKTDRSRLTRMYRSRLTKTDRPRLMSMDRLRLTKTDRPPFLKMNRPPFPKMSRLLFPKMDSLFPKTENRNWMTTVEHIPTTEMML